MEYERADSIPRGEKNLYQRWNEKSVPFTALSINGELGDWLRENYLSAISACPA